jgi:peptide-methionine (S)-S-oxide reductase
LLGRRKGRPDADFLERGSAFVEKTDRNWSSSLLDRSRRAHRSTIVAGATERKPIGCAARPVTPSFLMTTEKATFGAGCFWGVEETFRNLKGVTATAVGYAGGKKDNPTYEDVCSDETGHAEVVQVEFDPDQISYDKLLDVFWANHNPTTLNRQGPDVGTQYRSVIFYHSPEQKAAAEASKEKISASGKFNRPVVTQIEPAPKFWRAEEYHQQYLAKRGQSHCAI